MIPQCLIEIELDGTLNFSNDSGKITFGFNTENNNNLYNYVDSKSAKILANLLEKEKTFESSYATPIRLKNTRNECIPCLLYLDKITQNNDKIVAIILIVDISEQKRIEGNLQKAKSKYSRILNNVQDAIFVINKQGLILESNIVAQKMFNYSSKEFRSILFNDLCYECDFKFLKESKDEKQDSILITSKCIKANGDVFPVEINSQFINENEESFVASVRDISDRVKSQKTILKLSKAIEQMKIAVAICNENAVIEYFNPVYNNLNEVSEDVIGTKHKLLESLLNNDGFVASLENTGFWSKLIESQNDLFDTFNFFTIHQIKSSENTSNYIILQEDITIQEHMKKKVDEQNKLTKVVVDSIPDIIYFKDKENRFLGCNKAFEEFINKKENEIIGRDDIFVYEDQNYASIQHYQDQNVINFQTSERFNTKVSVNGNKIKVDTVKLPFYDEANSLLGLVSVSHDLTLQKRIESDLKKAKYEAEKARTEAENASLAKSHFLANMSHEIRTPLNGISGITSLLLNTELSKQQKEYLNLVISSSDSLLNIVNDILDFSKIEAGEIGIENRNFTFLELINNLIKMFSYRAFTKNLEFIVDLSPALPKIINSDEKKIFQILSKLLDNAIKFTESGYIVLSIHPLEMSQGTLFINFMVKDSGIGVEMNKISEIFEDFNQGDVSFTRKFGGTGLGLSIAKQLAKVLNSEIKVENNSDKGATFELTVPVGLVNEETYIPYTSEFKDKNVLLLESVNESADSIKATLNFLQCNLITANTIDKANFFWEQQTETIHFNYIFIDENFYILSDGEKVLEFTEKTKIPIIIFHESHHGYKFSAFDDETKYLRLLKPILPHQVIEALLFNFAKTSVKTKTILYADDSYINRQVVTAILEQAEFKIISVVNGQEALDLSQENKYDLILMDKQMPVMDGIISAKLIKEKSLNMNTPIIGTSGFSDEKEFIEMKKVGMVDFIGKPILADKLIEKVERWTSFVPLDESDDEEKLVCLNYLKELAGNDDAFILSIYNEFNKVYKEEIESIKINLDEHNYDSAYKSAHKLKGSVSYFGAEKMHQKIKDLEQKIKNETNKNDILVNLKEIDKLFVKLNKEMVVLLS